MLFHISLIFFILNRVEPFLFNYSTIKVLSISDQDSYFGYSILLQKGNPSLAIVGAPWKKIGDETPGAVYRCDLTTFKCSAYSRISRTRSVYPRNKTGDLLGLVLDGSSVTGEDIFTCAPKFISVEDSTYYSKGKCFWNRNSQSDANFQVLMPLGSGNSISTIDSNIYYYDEGLAEAGQSIAYLNKEKTFLVGAPSKALGTGSLIRMNLNSARKDILPQTANLRDQSDNYFGYAVTWGRFIRGHPTVWYVSGGPRGAGLKGHVVIFNENLRGSENIFGEELGSYFGASLLAVTPTGRTHDLLVGAPMFSGDSHDEGCVYYYKSYYTHPTLGSFKLKGKLTNGKTLSRFGTAMSNLGDINLDYFNDVAIAAPFEDGGMGAVYIYFGGENGFHNDHSYRITPSEFPLHVAENVRGFGLGLSRGNDIDNNGHNDVAIGAFKSGQVFYLRTNQLFDIAAKVSSETKILYTSSSSFTMTYCISFSFRKRGINGRLTFLTNLVLEDDRFANKRNITRRVELKTGEESCIPTTLQLRGNHLNIEPLTIPYTCEALGGMGQAISKFFSIPMTFECGSDNVCEPDLSLSASTTQDEIVPGLTTTLRINIEIENKGESAYQTKLMLTVPQGISLINLRECDLRNESYICIVSNELRTKSENYFLLDVTSISPDLNFLPVSISVESLGKDLNLSDNKIKLSIPVVLRNEPYIESRSEPESAFLNKSLTFLNLTHYFIVGNHGPSPLNLNLSLLVPLVELNGRKIVEIESIEATMNGVSSSCDLTDRSFKFEVKEGADSKNVITCKNKESQCAQITCLNDYLYKGNKNALFKVDLVFRVAPFAEVVDRIGNVFFITTALFTNGTDNFSINGKTLIITNINKEVPMWIYIISTISGILLFLLIIFVLYKCNFFKRRYKELRESAEAHMNEEILVPEGGIEELDKEDE